MDKLCSAQSSHPGGAVLLLGCVVDFIHSGSQHYNSNHKEKGYGKNVRTIERQKSYDYKNKHHKYDRRANI